MHCSHLAAGRVTVLVAGFVLLAVHGSVGLEPGAATAATVGEATVGEGRHEGRPGKQSERRDSYYTWHWKPPTKPPTWNPTWKPTTKPPTWNPTWKPTTKPPTWNPTWKPTTKPPTWNPTWKPTWKPTWPLPPRLPPPPPGVDCECELGITQIAFAYSGGTITNIRDSDSDAVVRVEGNQIIASVPDGERLGLNNNFIIEVNGVQTEWHTSCSETILGVERNGLLVVSHVDTQKNLSEMMSCPNGSSSRGSSGKGASGKGASRSSPSGKGASGKGASGKGASGGSPSGKGASGKGASRSSPSGNGASGKGASGKGASGKGASGKGASGVSASGSSGKGKGSLGGRKGDNPLPSS